MPGNDKRLTGEFGPKAAVGRNVFSWRPQVSIVIPAYNVAEYIGETLASVAAQKFRDYEVIVVNDGSPDTVELERSLKPFLEDIVYLKQKNLGAGVARNVAIDHSRAHLIAFLDGDDIWLPDFLASQIAFLGRGYDMVYCDAVLFGMRSPYRRRYMESAPSRGEADFTAILDLRCNVITSGTVARKQTIVAAGMFENEKVTSEDFHLWLRIAKMGGKVGYQQKQLLKYRIRPDSLSGDSVDRIERGIDVFRRVRTTIELNAEQIQIVNRRLSGLEADLAIEQGKAFLLSGDFREASVAFHVANRHRRSLKLTLITYLSRLAPRILLNHYRKHRPDDAALIPIRKSTTASP